MPDYAARVSVSTSRSVTDVTARATLLDPSLAAASWRRSPGPMTSWLEAEMFGEKRDEHTSFTNAKCDKVNIKLDSPQSESDRGESQLNVARAACWLHFLLPSHWIDEHRSLCILDISPGALSLSILSKSLISVCRTLLNSRSSY